MTERISNNASTTLNGTINNSTTTIVVTNATGFPPSGNFRIIIGGELMLVTGVSGNTFTVTRGIEGTAPASHASGLNITHILTAGSMFQLLAENGGGPTTTLTVSDFTQHNFTDAITTNGTGSVLLEIPAQVSGGQYQWLTRPWTTGSVTLCFDQFFPGKHLMNSVVWGIGFLETSTHKVACLGTNSDETDTRKFWSFNTQLPYYSYASGEQSLIPIPPRFWMRISNDGTTVMFEVSYNGVDFARLHSELVSDYATSAYNAWCFGGICYQNSTDWPSIKLRLLSCVEAP
jgi:hypothetical protein